MAVRSQAAGLAQGLAVRVESTNGRVASAAATRRELSRRCALEGSSSASCPAQNSRLGLASLPQPGLEVRSLRNAARQYPCARPFVLSPRAAKLSVRPAEHLFAPGLELGPGL